MKFKVFSVVLLCVCFVLLGVMSGVIPVRGGDVPAAAIYAGATEPPSGSAPSPSPSDGSDAGSTAPAARTVPPATEAPTPTGTPRSDPEPTPAPTAESTAEPERESPPEPEPAPERETVEDPWTPDVEVISTTITSDSPLRNDTAFTVDAADLMERAPAVTLSDSGYQILIIHTHATEAYTPDGEDQYEAVGDYRTTDTDHNVVRVGRALAEALGEYGLNVLVDTGLYDYPSYNGSYARSAEAIQAYLAEYPSISMVIDLHRDALGDDERIYKTISDQVQPDAAQIMFVMGSDTNLSFPGWEDNLDLALSLQGLVESKYPHLMRPTILCAYRYNQQLTAGSVLMEVGTTGNTMQEAITAVELFADAVGPALAARVGA